MEENKCTVCGGELETLFYMDIDSMYDDVDWFCSVKTEQDVKKKLKYCKNCGLVYAK